MPLNKDSEKVESPGSDFKPVPEDIYQVVVQDVEERESTKYQSDETEMQYFFKFIILDGDEETKYQMVTAWASRKWFAGSKKASPSKLINIVKAIYAYYYPKLDVKDLTAEDMSVEVINDLIGKQLRVSVKYNDDQTRNKITDFTGIKTEIKFTSDELTIDLPKNTAEPKVGSVSKKDEPKKAESGGPTEVPKDLPF